MSDLSISASVNGTCTMKDCRHVNPNSHQMSSTAGRPVDRPGHLPRLSRNRWARPDLARLMGTETDYAPYITPADAARRQPGS